MKITVVLLSLMLLTGCASAPAPNFFNGQYYMAGDASCESVRALSDTRVMCIDKDGKDTGYRDAITAEQITMWGQQQALQAQQAAATRQSIRDNNQALAAQTQQTLQGIGQFGSPQVSQPSGQGGITYTQVGTSLVGSNGVTYKVVGNTIFGSDGTTCQVVSSQIICN